MKMKRILNEWKKFVSESIDYTKTPLETRIEEKWAQMGLKYNEELANAKAAAHAIEFMSGGEKANQQSYLDRVEFGKSNKQRIIDIYENPSKFADNFDMYVVEKPPYDKRFGDVKQVKGVKMVASWAHNNLDRGHQAVFGAGKNEDDAYANLFERFELFAQMLELGDYNFLSRLGKVVQWRTTDDRHSGGAFSTGLIIMPEEATDAEVEPIMNSYKFFLAHQADPAYIMAIKAEEELQKALKGALSIWKKYGGFKDGADEQANKGAWLRMQKRLQHSEETVEKIKADPGIYKVSPTEPKQEDVEILIAKAEEGEKEAAEKAYQILKKAGDKRSRRMRQLMRKR
jgi:hypothetical protein